MCIKKFREEADRLNPVFWILNQHKEVEDDLINLHMRYAYGEMKEEEYDRLAETSEGRMLLHDLPNREGKLTTEQVPCAFHELEWLGKINNGQGADGRYFIADNGLVSDGSCSGDVEYKVEIKTTSISKTDLSKGFSSVTGFNLNKNATRESIEEEIRLHRFLVNGKVVLEVVSRIGDNPLVVDEVFSKSENYTNGTGTRTDCNIVMFPVKEGTERLFDSDKIYVVFLEPALFNLLSTGMREFIENQMKEKRENGWDYKFPDDLEETHWRQKWIDAEWNAYLAFRGMEATSYSEKVAIQNRITVLEMKEKYNAKNVSNENVVDLPRNLRKNKTLNDLERATMIWANRNGYSNNEISQIMDRSFNCVSDNVKHKPHLIEACESAFKTMSKNPEFENLIFKTYPGFIRFD